MKKKNAFLACCIIFCIACKKGDGGGNNWRMPMIKTATVNNFTTTYWHDRQGRVIKTEDAAIRTEYSYTGDSLFFKSTELATNASKKYAGKLNANGRLVYLGGTEYKYDASDRLTETLFAPGGDGWRKFNQYYYNSATGLLDSMRQSESRLVQTRWKQTIIYTYYTDMTETHGYENQGAGFWGRNAPHPVNHTDVWTPISQAPYRKITYTMDNHYAYDDAGRIVVEDHDELRPDNTSVQWRTVYTYY